MRNCWAILGIEPTEDKKKIRKAYSSLVKLYHPEDDKNAYQELRKAYEIALQHCESFTYEEDTSPLLEPFIPSQKRELPYFDLQIKQEEEEIKSTFVEIYVETNIKNVVDGTRKLCVSEKVGSLSAWKEWFDRNKGNEELILHTIFEDFSIDLNRWVVDDKELSLEILEDTSLLHFFVDEIDKLPTVETDTYKEKLHHLKLHYNNNPSENKLSFGIKVLSKFFFLYCGGGSIAFAIGAIYFAWSSINTTTVLSYIDTLLFMTSYCSFSLSIKIVSRIKNKNERPFWLNKEKRWIIIFICICTSLYLFGIVGLILTTNKILAQGILFTSGLIAVFIYYRLKKKQLRKDFQIKPVSLKSFSYIYLVFVFLALIGFAVSLVRFIQNNFNFNTEGAALLLMTGLVYIQFRPVHLSGKRVYMNIRKDLHKFIMLSVFITGCFSFRIIIQYILGNFDFNQEVLGIGIIYIGWIITLVNSRIIEMTRKKKLKNIFQLVPADMLSSLFDHYCDYSSDGTRIRNLNSHEAAFYYIQRFIEELHHGGFYHFYCYQTADHIDVIVDELKLMGADDIVKLIEASTTIFTNRIVPHSLEDRQKILTNDENTHYSIFKSYDYEFYEKYPLLEKTMYDYIIRNKKLFTIK